MAYVVLLIGLLAVLWTGREFVDGHLGDLDLGPFPKGMPVNVLMNFDPESSLDRRLAALRGLCDMLGTLRAADEKERASEEARRVALENDPSTPEDKLPRLYRLSDADRLKVFEHKAGPALMAATRAVTSAFSVGPSGFLLSRTAPCAATSTQSTCSALL